MAGNVDLTVKSMDIRWMSDEESDDDDLGPLRHIVAPTWRSPALSVFLHGLDQQNLNGTLRLVEGVSNDYAEVPMGLPLNYYSSTWLSEEASKIISDKAKPAVFFMHEK
jgi:hypothetical protein